MTFNAIEIETCASQVIPIHPPRLTGIETFCGAGGMSLGLQLARIDVHLAFDYNQREVETYNGNIP